MTLMEVVRHLDLRIYLDQMCSGEVTGGYCSDMLSDVMMRAKEGDLWFTLHGHVNIVAAGAVAGVTGIVITGGRKPEAKTLVKAKEEGINVFGADESTFEIAGKLYELLKKA